MIETIETLFFVSLLIAACIWVVYWTAKHFLTTSFSVVSPKTSDILSKVFTTQVTQSVVVNTTYPQQVVVSKPSRMRIPKQDFWVQTYSDGCICRHCGKVLNKGETCNCLLTDCSKSV